MRGRISKSISGPSFRALKLILSFTSASFAQTGAKTKGPAKLSIHALMFLALLLCGGLTVFGQMPGDLDPTFGNGGIVITNRHNANGNGNNLYGAYAMAIQADGKIVVVGEAFTNESDWWDFAVVRYNPDGSLDNSFGGGIVNTAVGDSADIAHSVAIQTDGKIVVAGSTSCAPCTDYSFAVVRYNPDGSLDTSFNGTGIVSTPVGTGSGASDLAIQADGTIVVAGWSRNSNFAIVRYNADGSLDTSFNGSGKVVTPVGYASSVAIQADGKIVVAGSSSGSILDSYFVIVRYNPDGSLDTSFNGTGNAITSVGNSGSSASDLAIQTDGKIVVAGGSLAAAGNWKTTDCAIVRYNPDGSLDTSFGGTGKILIPDSDSVDYARSVAIQPNGKIVVAGDSSNIGSDFTVEGSDFALVRLNPNGSRDTSFNRTGTVTTSVGNGWATASSVAIQADGKIVVAGDTGPDDLIDFAVVRYQGDGAKPTTCSNPIDCADFFVRQHYQDFLNREPDQSGWDYWTNQITQCGSDTRCIHERRIGVSGAFFVEMEFQDTGYYVYRFYKATFGRQPTYTEFTTDRANLVVGPNLEANKQAFADEWVQRPAFLAAYPITLSNTEVVNKLFDSAGLTSSIYDTQRQQEILAMNAGRSRALVLRDVIEIADFKNAPNPNDPRYAELKQISQYNPAFVLMQYFGYLRRNVDQSGYDFWLDVVNNREPNNYHGMVCAFITSSEYQLRFGATVTHSNADCSQ